MTGTMSNTRHTNRTWAKRGTFIVMMIICGAVIARDIYKISQLPGDPPWEDVNYTDTPLHVEHVTGYVNGKTLHRGHIIITPEWAVMVDAASLSRPSPSHGQFEPVLLNPSKTLASLAEIAKLLGEPLKFKGVKARKKTYNGLPVMLVTHVTYAGQDFPVSVYKYH